MKKSCFFVLVLVASLVFHCSREDSPIPSPNVEDPTTKEPEDPPIDDQLRVDFSLTQATSEISKNCNEPFNAQPLNIANKITVDGDLKEWETAGVRFNDPRNDSKGPIDIVGGGIALEGENLYVGIDGIAEADLIANYVYLEFYTAFFAGNVIGQLKHVIRLSKEASKEPGKEPGKERAHIFQNGTWTELPSPFAIEFKQKSLSIEVRLSITNLLSGVLVSPLWGVQLSVGDPSKRWVDYTEVMFFRGSISEGFGQFFREGCETDTFSNLNLRLLDIGPTGQSFKDAAGIIRFVESRLSNYFEGIVYPVSTIAIMYSNSPTNFARPAELIGSGSISDFVNLPLISVINNSGRFGINNDSSFKIEKNYRYRAIERIVAGITKVYLDGSYKNSTLNLRETITYAIVSHFIKENLGVARWLDFVGRQEAIGPRMGILLEDKLAHDLKDPKLHIGAVLLDKWAEASNREMGDEANQKVDLDFWVGLRLIFPQYKDFFDSISGGLQPDISEPDFVKLAFLDGDFDGLPAFFEAGGGSNLATSKVDTDFDGWSDLAEIALGKDSGNPMSRPDILVADGIFGDFLDLIPGSIIPDVDSEISYCKGAGNIVSYSVILSHDLVMIGIRHDDEKAVTNDSIRWEIDFDAPITGGKSQIRIIRTQRRFNIIQADGKAALAYGTIFPNGMYAVEALVERADIGLAADDAELKVRISAYQNNDAVFCDDTPWFKPFSLPKKQ